MTSQNAASFFANVQTSTAVRVEVARFVEAGESVALATDLGIAIECSIEEPGWYLPGLNGGFMVEQSAFSESVIQPEMLQNFVLQNFALDNLKVVKVKQNDIYTAYIGFLIETSAPCEGYVLIPEGSWGDSGVFFAEILYNAIFGDQEAFEGQHIVALEELPFQCVVLTEETTFSFIAGEYTAPAGYILYENSEDEDGYTVVSPLNFLKDYVILK